jgi:hypothetical protein
MYNGKLKQSRQTSALGFFGGLIFIGIGIFIAIPIFGAFGIFWTMISAGITVYHGYGLFSKRGVSLYEVEVSGGQASRRSLAEKLNEIDEAKRLGKISESEYRTLRTRILSE